MAVSVADAPYSGSFTVVGQPLVYRFSSSTAMTNKKYSVRVKQNGSTIATYLLTPNEADDAFFDLNTLAENLVNAPEGKGTGPIHSAVDRVFKTPSADGCVLFSVAVAEYDSGTTGTYTADSSVLLVPGNFTTAEGQPSLVEFKPQFNMGDDGENQKTFMSEVPSVVDPTDGHQTTWYMGDDDEGITHFMFSSTYANTDSSIRLATAVKDADGTGLQTASTALLDDSTMLNYDETTSTAQNMHVAVAVGPKNIRTIMSWSAGTLANWATIEIYLRSNGSNEEYGWLLIKRADECHKAQIAWVNKYGSWDYIGFSAFTNETMNTQRKTIMKRLGDYNSANDYAAYKHSRVNDVYRVTGTTQYTLTKVFDSAQDALLLESCQRSRKHMVRIGDDWFPVVLDTGSVRVERSPRAKAPQVTLKCTLAQPVLC